MVNVEARIRIGNKHYEINVNLDEALKIKNGEGDITLALESPQIFYDLKKGTIASQSDLENDFNTTDIYEVARKIIKNGEVQKTQEFRDDEKDKKIRQVVSLILQNTTDQNGRPYTEDKIRLAIKDVHYNFDSSSPEKQMKSVVDRIKTILPIKIELKHIKVVIPAQYTGQVYGMIQEYKDSEEWRPNGDLQIIISIPPGISIDFFEKLNSRTHGSIQSEELIQD